MYISMVIYKHNIRGIFLYKTHMIVLIIVFPSQIQGKKKNENLKKKGYNLDGMLLIVLTATPW